MRKLFYIRCFFLFFLSLLLISCGHDKDEKDRKDNHPPDTTPNAFSFSAVNAPANTQVSSNAITVTGINAKAPIRVRGGEYAIDSAAFTNTAGTVSTNQRVVVRQTSAATIGQTTDTVLIIGDVSATFRVTSTLDNQAPTATILFPLSPALTQGQNIVVRGAANDMGTISSITVNGVAAVSSNGFANWSATVPLSEGINTLIVKATDNNANSNNSAATVQIERRQLFESPLDIEYDTGTSRLLIMDSSLDTLFGINVDTQTQRVISGLNIPDALNRFNNPTAVALDRANRRLLSLDTQNKSSAIVATNLSTGSRTVITQDNIPAAAHTMDKPTDIVVDSTNDRAYVLDFTRRSVVQFNLNTGTATRLNNNTIVWPDSMALDSINNRLLVTDLFKHKIVAINLTTGEQTDFSTSTVPNTNNPLQHAKGIVIDTAQQRALVLDTRAKKLVAVNLIGGARTVVAENLNLTNINTFDEVKTVLDSDNNRVLFSHSNTSGTIYAINLTSGVTSVFSNSSTPNTTLPLSATTGLTLDKSNNRILTTASVVKSGSGRESAVIAISLTDGSRRIVSDSETPDTTNPLVKPMGIDLDSPNSRALIADADLGSLVTVDLNTGARRIISDNSVPDSNNTFNRLTSIQTDMANNRALVFDAGRRALLSVNLSTNERKVISDRRTPNDLNLFEDPRDSILDGSRALVLDRSRRAIIAVDLSTGARTILSDDTTPDTANPFSFPTSMALDQANNRLLVADIDPEAIIAVDLDTGARTVFSDVNTPNGNHPFYEPSSITLDSVNNRVFIMSRASNTIVAANLTSGERTTVFGGTPNAVNPLMEVQGLAIDSVNNRALVTNSPIFYEDALALIAIDLNTGQRTVLSNNQLPNDTNPFSALGKLVLDIDNTDNRAFVINQNRDVIAVNLNGGARTILSSNTVPNGNNPLSDAQDLALDKVNNRLLVIDNSPSNPSIVAVSLTDGSRTMLSSKATPNTNNLFNDPQEIVLDSENKRALVVDSGTDALLAVDLTPGPNLGARTIISDSRTPNGNNKLSFPINIALDSTNNRALVGNENGQIIAVNLTSGARTVVSGFDKPDSHNLYHFSSGLALDAAHNRALVSDSTTGAVYAVDLVSGGRTILSK